MTRLANDVEDERGLLIKSIPPIDSDERIEYEKQLRELSEILETRLMNKLLSEASKVGILRKDPERVKKYVPAIAGRMSTINSEAK